MASQKKIEQRACNGDVAEFCEMVMLKEARKHTEKLDHRWLGRCCGLAKETSIWWLRRQGNGHGTNHLQVADVCKSEQHESMSPDEVLFFFFHDDERLAAAMS